MLGVGPQSRQLAMSVSTPSLVLYSCLNTKSLASRDDDKLTVALWSSEALALFIAEQYVVFVVHHCDSFKPAQVVISKYTGGFYNMGR